ncbi:M16 family metallopeptidase [Roseinatronobacter bogoriensis]|uniref:Insulinase family protein n=1 Tax=Roseinatronobacter bogoriensis subsp. barguzinensis TaxID=441209 RepID=A0A2K8KEA8_9RHOB|nr:MULTISPECIES: pitrilysin family protein [Rhodobaca]ATX65108.1 insulinase family protein [Rhodobaca barguzinensis]MBB4209597.1 zinc protease [Rhodobaca bogoriensis DSM 18756]TDW35412.1 zinc protease [Rhodobaca barguzinensis]TDY66622.1 zinc protease [Rhodobaca bogoriensis DSM 18756]
MFARQLAFAALLALGLLQPAYADSVTHAQLDNGLEIVVIEDRRAPVVVHMVWYRAGAADEPPGKSGIAHFLEHLMFKGTETRDPGEFSAIVEANGGRDNAFVSWDYTGFFQRVASDRLDLMMEMEADRMQNLSFTEAEWLPERGVILEERGQVLESRVGAQFNEAMLATLYKAHPYGTPILGWRHEMEGLTGEDAMEFYNLHYGPNNAVLVIAGDVDTAEALDLAEQHYGSIPANPNVAATTRLSEPPHLAERRIVFEDSRVGTPYVSRMYLAPVRRSGDQSEAAALQMLAALLGGSSTTSVLERRLNFEEGVALSAWASYNGMARDYGVFSLGIAPVDGVSLEEAEAALDRVVAEFLEEGVDTAQFERVRRQLRASEIYGLDDAQSRARQFGVGLSIGLNVDDIEGWIDALEAVTPEDVIDAGQMLLDRRAAVTGYLTLPQEPELSQ